MPFEKITVTSEYKNITPVSKKIREFLLAQQVSEQFCNEIEICLMEALNNVIKHAYEEESGKSIYIYFSMIDDSVEVNIIDTGIARVNTEKPKLNFDPDDINTVPESGMGLYIIDSLMDSTEYITNNGVNTFKLIKKISS